MPISAAALSENRAVARIIAAVLDRVSMWASLSYFVKRYGVTPQQVLTYVGRRQVEARICRFREGGVALKKTEVHIVIKTEAKIHELRAQAAQLEQKLNDKASPSMNMGAAPMGKSSSVNRLPSTTEARSLTEAERQQMAKHAPEAPKPKEAEALTPTKASQILEGNWADIEFIYQEFDPGLTGVIDRMIEKGFLQSQGLISPAIVRYAYRERGIALKLYDIVTIMAVRPLFQGSEADKRGFKFVVQRFASETGSNRVDGDTCNRLRDLVNGNQTAHRNVSRQLLGAMRRGHLVMADKNGAATAPLAPPLAAVPFVDPVDVLALTEGLGGGATAQSSPGADGFDALAS